MWDFRMRANSYLTGVSRKEGIYLVTGGTSTTTPSALFRSRTTVNLQFFLLFLLVTKDGGWHGDTGTKAAMCLETWSRC